MRVDGRPSWAERFIAQRMVGTNVSIESSMTVQQDHDLAAFDEQGVLFLPPTPSPSDCTILCAFSSCGLPSRRTTRHARVPLPSLPLCVSTCASPPVCLPLCVSPCVSALPPPPSHELRTPMAGIIGLLDLLACDSLSAEQEAMVLQIRRCAMGLLALVNNILDISKVSEHQPRMHDAC